MRAVSRKLRLGGMVRLHPKDWLRKYSANVAFLSLDGEYAQHVVLLYFGKVYRPVLPCVDLATKVYIVILVT